MSGSFCGYLTEEAWYYQSGNRVSGKAKQAVGVPNEPAAFGGGRAISAGLGESEISEPYS